jgi:hypothetical protein
LSFPGFTEADALPLASNQAGKANSEIWGLPDESLRATDLANQLDAKGVAQVATPCGRDPIERRRDRETQNIRAGTISRCFFEMASRFSASQTKPRL